MRETEKYAPAPMSHAKKKEFAVSVCTITEKEGSFQLVILHLKLKQAMTEA